jgi:hypothetical protein
MASLCLQQLNRQNEQEIKTTTSLVRGVYDLITTILKIK